MDRVGEGGTKEAPSLEETTVGEEEWLRESHDVPKYFLLSSSWW